MRKVAFVLTPASSKRLIARAVAVLPEVQSALNHGRLIVSGGTTNAYIAEELTGQPVEKNRYTAGIITNSVWGATPVESRIKPFVFDHGRLSTRPWLEVLGEFSRGDVLIKGGNALDPSGLVGILLSAKNGGTIGSAFGHVVAAGAHLIIPIGLEKLIPSVVAAANILGQQELDDCIGSPCGMFPVAYGTVITEIEAIDVLYGLEAVHVHSGGVGGSEGAVGIVAYGDSVATELLMQDVATIKSEMDLAQ